MKAYAKPNSQKGGPPPGIPLPLGIIERPNKSLAKGVFRGDEGGTLKLTEKFSRFGFLIFFQKKFYKFENYLLAQWRKQYETDYKYTQEVNS